MPGKGHACNRQERLKMLVMVSFFTWFMVSWMFTLSELQGTERRRAKEEPTSQAGGPNPGFPAGASLQRLGARQALAGWWAWRLRAVWHQNPGSLFSCGAQKSRGRSDSQTGGAGRAGKLGGSGPPPFIPSAEGETETE